VTFVHHPEMQIVPLPPSTIVEEIPGQPKVFVPHFLPGTNSGLKEFAEKFGIPYEATWGGKKMTYPEYRTRLKTLTVNLRGVLRRRGGGTGTNSYLACNECFFAAPPVHTAAA
jgi:hypothetical protein